MVGGALDAVNVAEAGVGVDDGPVADLRIGRDLGDSDSQGATGPSRAIRDNRDPVGGPEGNGVSDAPLL
nr:hypothetical protein [uncultured bacterium]